MTIDELFYSESKAEITIIEKNTGKELCQQECGDAECDWDYSGDENSDDYWMHITAKVQEEKEIPYIHVGAPAPQYAINSISKIAGAISYAASKLGYHARDERGHNMVTDVILDVNVTDDQVKEIFETAAKDMIDEGYTGVDFDSTSLNYDSASASFEHSELTRNW